jgi:hypothetical protein
VHPGVVEQEAGLKTKMSRRRIRRAVGTMMPLGEDVLDRKQDLESTECSRHLLRSRRSIAITLTFTEDGRMYAYLLTFVPNVVALSARLRRSQFGILMKPTSMSNGSAAAPKARPNTCGSVPDSSRSCFKSITEHDSAGVGPQTANKPCISALILRHAARVG